MSAIGIVFGGSSPEHDISILTGLQAARALAKGGADIACLYWARDGAWWSVPTSAEATDFLDPAQQRQAVEFSLPGGFALRGRLGRSTPMSFDVILNCCHGGPGEDGTLSALLNLAGLRTTGPSAQTCALFMDKLATSALAVAYGVPTIDTVLWRPTMNAEDLGPGPWVAKPRFGGSSLGIEADIGDVQTLADMAQSGPAKGGLLVQPYLKGWVDLNIAVRGYPGLELSGIERPLKSDEGGVYGFEDKYLRGEGMQSAPRQLPADIPPDIAGSMREWTTRLAASWGPTGAARVDYLWDGNQDLRLCEINAIPGSWGTYLWAETGITREQLLSDLAAEAIAQPPIPPQWAASSTGAALRAAGSISSKLA